MSTDGTYLFVIDSFGAGGAERSLLEMLPILARGGTTPVVACLRRRDVGFEEEVRQSGADVRIMEGGGRIAKIAQLRRLIRKIHPDLIYTSLFEADLVGRLAAFGLPPPVMVNLANTAYDPARLADPNVSAWRLRFVQLVDRLLARYFTDHFHAISQAVKESTVDTLGVSPDRITVVRRGRDLERIGEASQQRRQEVRKALGVGLDAEMVVAVGRQEYQKGHLHLVGAFADVVRLRPKARLFVVGREGHATGVIRERVTACGVGEAVTFLGHRPDVTDVMAASDIFVFPSLYEGLGGALIEALALGLPAVVSDIPALREVVEPGENADLVPPGDEAGLASAIVSLLDDGERRVRYGRRSHEIFSEHFRATPNAEAFVELLRRVAGR